MSADQYLQGILERESVDTALSSPVRSVQTRLGPIIQEWAGDKLVSVSPSGSFAKGTAIKSGTDIDLFISLSAQTPGTLKEIYNNLFNRMNERGYAPKIQNVSVKVRVDGYEVDLVPAKRQDSYTDNHSLYRRRADTWTKTNVTRHITYVSQFGRANEIRIVKVWRNQKGVDFPSFFLELSVIGALAAQYGGTLSGNLRKVFQYFRDSFPNACLTDPANINNVISDDLTAAEKANVKASAITALGAKDWSEIVT